MKRKDYKSIHKHKKQSKFWEVVEWIIELLEPLWLLFRWIIKVIHRWD
jgi:hypothetical protein